MFSITEICYKTEDNTATAFTLARTRDIQFQSDSIRIYKLDNITRIKTASVTDITRVVCFSAFALLTIATIARKLSNRLYRVSCDASMTATVCSNDSIDNTRVENQDR